MSADLWQDLRYGMRAHGKSAMGIGVNMVIFSFKATRFYIQRRNKRLKSFFAAISTIRNCTIRRFSH